jgi:predicted nucleic acid-binding protein
MAGDFIDTNVLVYVASDDVVKADRATRVLAEGGATSVQVLNEATNVARKKMRMSWGDTYDFLSLIRRLLTVHPVTLETHMTGLGLAERHGISIWDAMIAAAALHAGCDRLWTEDLRHGQLLDGRLRIANLFHEPG